MNWQPISTAPKDGTWIIAISPSGHVRRIHFFAPSSRTQEWRVFGTQSRFYPKEWMPLPEPPEMSS
jgi:hypothetical protein